jgi:hypothetical protein
VGLHRGQFLSDRLVLTGSHPFVADAWAVLFPDCIRGAANNKWGRSIGLPQPMTSGVVYFSRKYIYNRSVWLPQPMTSGVVYFSGKDIYYRSVGLPQPMTSGVFYLFRENYIFPLCGASAANDRWGRLFI